MDISSQKRTGPSLDSGVFDTIVIRHTADDEGIISRSSIRVPVKAETGHIIFNPGFRYRQLKDIFPELMTVFLQESDQMPEEKEILSMFIEINMMDLRANRKPEGYNRKGRMRLIFPIGRKEMYIAGNSSSTEIVRVTEKLSKMLQKKGIKNTVEWDQFAKNL
jgi:hypothetical protein